MSLSGVLKCSKTLHIWGALYRLADIAAAFGQSGPPIGGLPDEVDDSLNALHSTCQDPSQSMLP